MTQITIIDSVGGGGLHVVAIAGAVAVYLRDTDKPGMVESPDWLQEAGKVKSWADGKGGARAQTVRADIKASGLYGESRPLARGVYGLAVYPACDTARRVTLAALAGCRDTDYSR